MTAAAPFHLFEVFGVELEYTIVDRSTLDVRPIADDLLRAAAGELVGDYQDGPIGWSNELALHVIELKTAYPSRGLTELTPLFQRNVQRMDQLLAPMGAMLLPGAMHPWMNPHTELRLWPHDYNAVYEAFDRIFGCTGHGWANLQSAHLNLPFAGDDQFGRLHAAIRLVLPLLPALAASSPIADGRFTGLLDTRLETYRHNAARIPTVCGRVIPEQAFTQDEYELTILAPLYRDLAPHDPEGILQEEWANARGCIARFDRGAIEIRVLDVQECPAADLAIIEAIVALVRALADGPLRDDVALRAWPVEPLAEIFLRGIRDADAAVIDNAAYLAALGLKDELRLSAREVWMALLERFMPAGMPRELEVILREGCLARRIVGALKGDTRREALREVCVELARSLVEGRQFHAGA